MLMQLWRVLQVKHVAAMYKLPQPCLQLLGSGMLAA